MLGDFTNAVERWLLSTKIQARSGPHSGGVAGWLNQAGRPVFLYPEITGYFLMWLTFLAEIKGLSMDLADRAGRAIEWIARHYDGTNEPRTRIYLEKPHEPDWRNSGIFAFDLAMLARGTAAARLLHDTERRTDTLARLTCLLVRFCDDDQSLIAFRPLDPDEPCEVPQRWSVNSGPYQSKVAAAILSAKTHAPLPAPLHLTAESSYRHWRSHSTRNEIHPEPHPAFYHMEGLAIAAANGWDPDAWSILADAYLHAVGMKTPAASFASFFNGSAFETRSDILAQALRMGSILRSRGLADPARLDERLAHLHSALRSYATDDGALLFSKTAPAHKNVWSALFAHQALSFYEVVKSGRTIPDRWIQLLV